MIKNIIIFILKLKNYIFFKLKKLINNKDLQVHPYSRNNFANMVEFFELHQYPKHLI